ncbi:hypothetical protein GCM10020331_070480 [Ectobacillus funiculus]
MGVYNFVRFTGAAIGPLFGTTLYHLGGDDALYITLFVFLLGSAFCDSAYHAANNRIAKRERRQESSFR